MRCCGADDGPGISPEIQPHIFEPFFTTKGVGEGTGLGLDTVQRIVKKHRGNIQVSSKPGDTRFQVWLPLAEGSTSIPSQSWRRPRVAHRGPRDLSERICNPFRVPCGNAPD